MIEVPCVLRWNDLPFVHAWHIKDDVPNRRIIRVKWYQGMRRSIRDNSKQKALFQYQHLTSNDSLLKMPIILHLDSFNLSPTLLPTLSTPHAYSRQADTTKAALNREFNLAYIVRKCKLPIDFIEGDPSLC